MSGATLAGGREREEDFGRVRGSDGAFDRVGGMETAATGMNTAAAGAGGLGTVSAGVGGARADIAVVRVGGFDVVSTGGSGAGAASGRVRVGGVAIVLAGAGGGVDTAHGRGGGVDTAHGRYGGVDVAPAYSWGRHRDRTAAGRVDVPPAYAGAPDEPAGRRGAGTRPGSRARRAVPEPLSLPGRARPRGARDEGSVSLLFAGVAIAVLLLIGLVVDGGGRLRAAQRADSLAAEAARAAAQAIDPAAAIQDGAVQMNPNTGVPAATARAYLARAGASGTVSIGADRVTLTVTVTVPFKPVFSGMLTDGSVSATARVTLVHGVIAPEGKTS